MIIIIFLTIFILYAYFLYKKDFRFISLFFLTAFALSFLIPTIIGFNNIFGYVVDEKSVGYLNRLYLFSLILFIIVNLPFQLVRHNIDENKINILSSASVKRVLFLFAILALSIFIILGSETILYGTTHVMGRNSLFKMVHAITILGFILTAGLNYMNKEANESKLIALFIFLLSIVFGVSFVFGRRLVLYPLIVLYILYVYKKKKAPNILSILTIGSSIVFIVLPMMMSIRTLGLKEGVNNFINLVFTTTNNYYFKYLAIGTDVGYSYTLANLVVNYDIRVPVITLFKPLFILIPRSIWSDKPKPLSEMIVEKMQLPYDEGMSIPLGFVGEPFVYFGLIGIFVWPMIFGLLCGLIDGYIISLRNINNSWRSIQMVFALMVSVQLIMGSIRGDTATNVFESLYLFVPLFIIFKLSRYNFKT